MSEKWTDDQLEAINTTDKAVIVSAAAGSGKTAVLIERTIRLLVDEEKQMPADKLLAVTFTNDAASQMREKLNNALNKKIEENPSNEWLQLQQTRLQLAKISTINSFCLDLVKNNIQNFDISNGVRILDDTENSLMLSEAIEKVIEKYYINNPEAISTLNNALCDGDDSKLDETIIRLYNYSRSLPFKDSWFIEALGSFDKDSEIVQAWKNTVKGVIIEEVSRAKEMAETARNSALKLQFHDKTKEKICNDYEHLSKCLDSLNKCNWDEIADTISSVAFLGFSSSDNKKVKGETAVETALVEYIKVARKSYKDTFDDVKKRLANFYSEAQIELDLKQSKALLEILIDIINDLWNELWERKVEKNAIDFSDVEILSIQLLAKETENGYEKTELAKEIVSGNDYRIIMIDEFQDVNNLQDIIFKMLSDSDKNEIIGKNMFVVGDVKQSIYRFRQANPNIFIQTRKDAHQPDNNEIIKEIKLKKNFRSRKCVIDFVNFVFGSIMSSEIGEVEYDIDEALDLGAKYDERELETEIFVVESEDEAESDEKSDEEEFCGAEAEAVAKRISRLIDDEVTVFENGEIRPCRQSDFCILLRKNADSEGFVKALRKYALLAQSEDQNGYLRSREISVLINLLRVIDSPMNDIALASVLLSPIFMFTTDELAEIRSIIPKSKLYRILILISEENERTADFSESLKDKCKSVFNKIRELRIFSSSVTLENLIMKIYDETDFFLFSSMYSDSKQKQANLRLLLEYAGSYEKSVGNGLTGFIRYIDAVFKNKQDFKQAGTNSSTSDAVIIKTIHKSKGLEFPFVFLCGISSQFAFRRNDLDKRTQMNLYNGIGFKLTDPENLLCYTTLPYDAIRLENEKEMLSEEMRLLYVALTRAKERLFITILKNNSFEKSVKDYGLEIARAGGITPLIAKSVMTMRDWIIMAMITHENGDYFRKLCGSDIEFPIKKTEAKVSVYTQEELSDLCKCTAEIKADEESADEIAPDEIIVNEIERYLDFKYDYTLSETSSKISVSEIAKKDSTLEFFYQLPNLNKEKGQLSPAEKGTATHALMELANYANAQRNLDAEIERLVSLGLLTSKQAKGINRKSVQAFFDGGFFARMKKSGNILREKQFLVMISELNLNDAEVELFKNTDGMLQGIADCIFEEDNGYVLVDYKTDNVSTVEELTEHYSLQIKLYKAAFDLILDKPVKSSYIYSFKLEKGIEVTF